MYQLNLTAKTTTLYTLIGTRFSVPNLSLVQCPFLREEFIRIRIAKLNETSPTLIMPRGINQCCLRIYYSHFMGGANVTCNCIYCLKGYVTDSHYKSTSSYHLGTKLCVKSLNDAVNIMICQGHHTTRVITKIRV